MIATQVSSAPTLSHDNVAKNEGDLVSYSRLFTEEKPPLPARYSALKKQLWNDSLVESWHGVLEALREKTEEVAQKGSTVRLPTEDVARFQVNRDE